MTNSRRRFKQRIPLKERLSSFSREARYKASQLPPCAEREDLMRKAQQADNAIRVDALINSSGLQPPKRVGLRYCL